MKMTFAELAAACGGTLRNASPDSVITSVSTDSRSIPENAMFLAVPGERFDGHDYLSAAREKGAVLLCAEESRADHVPAGAPVLLVPSTVRAYREIARAWRLHFHPVMIALTGSCGKTSSKEMLRSIFAAEFGEEAVLATEGNTNNHIGVPQNLLRLDAHHKACVIEIGTSHFGEIEPLARAVEPDAALIVSIARCHLENLLSLDGVAREKSHVYKYLREGGKAVIPADAEGRERMLTMADDHETILFGRSPESRMTSEYQGSTLYGSRFLLKDRKTGESIPVEWHLTGAHQAANAAGAAAVARAFGISLETIARGLASCSLPGLRMKHSDHWGAHWVNDAYNANPDSMRVSLLWLSEFADPSRLTLILGDMLEVGAGEAEAHQETLKLALEKFPDARIAAVGKRMCSAASALGSPSAIRCFADSDACREGLRELVLPGGLVFLKASRGTHLEKAEPAEA